MLRIVSILSMTGRKMQVILDEEYYTIDEVAKMVGAHPETIKRECWRKKITYMRISRPLLFKMEWIKEYIQRKTFFKK